MCAFLCPVPCRDQRAEGDVVSDWTDALKVHDIIDAYHPNLRVWYVHVHATWYSTLTRPSA